MIAKTLLPLAAVALLSSGCGSSGDTTTASSSATPAATAPASSGNTVTVEMKDIQFAPKDVTVKVGQTVKWVNEDSVVHDVKADSGASFSSALFGKGKSYEYKATKAGTIAYECTIHPGMTGTLTVK